MQSISAEAVAPGNQKRPAEGEVPLEFNLGGLVPSCGQETMPFLAGAASLATPSRRATDSRTSHWGPTPPAILRDKSNPITNAA